MTNNMTNNQTIKLKYEFEDNLKTLIDSKDVDFGKRSKDYATYRPGHPDSFYDRLQKLLSTKDSEWNWKDKTVIDIATGPGLEALTIARLGSKVVGIDISEGQIRQAKESAKEKGLE